MCAVGISETEFPVLEDVQGAPSARLRAAALIVQLVSNALDSGTEVHYIGSDARLNDIYRILELGHRALSMKKWAMPPLESIVRAVRRAFPEWVRDETANLPALGMMALPGELAERVVLKPSGKPILIVIDGGSACTADVRLALGGISVFCRKHRATLAIFP